MGGSDSLRSSSRRNAGLKSHQCVTCNACSAYEKPHNRKLKNTSLISDSKTKNEGKKDEKVYENSEKILTCSVDIHKDRGFLISDSKSKKRKEDGKFYERSEKFKKPCTVNIDEDRRCVTSDSKPKRKRKEKNDDKCYERSEKIEICIADVHKDRRCVEKLKANLRVRSVKEKCSTNETNVLGIFGSRSFQSTNLTNGGVNQSVGSVSLKVKSGIQAKTIKGKQKYPKDDKFCKNLVKTITNCTLKVHKGRRCTDKSKTKVEVLKPKVNCIQGSSNYVKNRRRTNKKNYDETFNKSSESTCLMNNGEFLPQLSVAVENLKDPRNSISNLPKRRSTEPSVLDEITCTFVDGPFWQQLTSTANNDFQNEFLTNYNHVKHFVSQLIEKNSQSRVDYEVESRYGTDVTLNNIDEGINIFSEESISDFDLNLIDASTGLGSNDDKLAKNREQPFEISSASVAELTATFDNICGERIGETCEDLNPFSDSCNSFDANNTASDELNLSIPLLQNEQLSDFPTVFDHSDMPELSIMGENSFACEDTISQICVDLDQNSRLAETETECNNKQTRIVSTDDSIKSEYQSVTQEISGSGNGEINLDDFIRHFSNNYDDCMVLEKYEKYGDEKYKCGKCCKLFELKAAHLHKNCDINIRTVLIDDLNFICMKCRTFLKNFYVLSTHKEKCPSAKKSFINKSDDLNMSGCSKSLTGIDKIDLISYASISKVNQASNFSCQPQRRISNLNCPPYEKQIAGNHAQEQQASIIESKDSNVSNNVLAKVLSPNIQNNQSMKSNMDLKNSQCKLTHPVTALDSEMSVFIKKMAECGMSCSPNEIPRVSAPSSNKSMTDLLSYFRSLKIKKEEGEDDPELIPSTPETCIKCRKPLHFDMPVIEETCSSILYNNPLQLDLPCSVCKHIYPVVFRKDILNILTQFLDKFKNLQKDAVQEKKDIEIKIKEEIISPRIEQVVTISSDDFFKMNVNDTSNPTKNSLTQENSDTVKQTIAQNVDLNINISATNPVVPSSSSSANPVVPLCSSSVQEQIRNSSTASHNESSNSIQKQVIIPSEIILENVFLSDTDLYVKDSDPDHLTYTCAECFSNLMREQIATHFYEKHQILKNKFRVEDAFS